MTMHRQPIPPLAHLIQARMQELGCVTPEEFAQETDLSRLTVQSLLEGHDAMGLEYTPSLQALVNLSHALNRPAHELLYLQRPDALGCTVWDSN